MSGGSTAYDPSLDGLPANTFQGIDGDFMKVDVEDTTPDGGTLIVESTLHAGRAVRVDDNIPTKLRRTGPGIERAKLLDVNRQTGGIDLVNQTFKDIVEEFEPGMHQFFQVEYYDSKGKEKIGDGYWMIICQRLDTLHDNLCIPPRNEQGFIDEFNDKYAGRDKSKDRRVYSKNKVKGHHMWHDKYLPMSNLFSNELAERLIAANLSGLNYIRYDEA